MGFLGRANEIMCVKGCTQCLAQIGKYITGSYIATVRTLSGWCYGEDWEQFNRNRNKNRSLQICLDWGWQAKQTSNAKRSGHASLCMCVPFLQKFSFTGFNPRHDYSRLSPWASVGTQVPQTPHTCTSMHIHTQVCPSTPPPRTPTGGALE